MRPDGDLATVAAERRADLGRQEIRLLGPFAVLRDGQPLADHEIGSRKARALLKRLLVERDRVVGMDALAEVLWPDRPPNPPDRQLAKIGRAHV